MSTMQHSVQEFPTGAKRGSDLAGCRLSLIPPAALRAWGRAFAEGEQKYGRDNWLRGFPVTVMVDHAMEHILSFLSGDNSEDHMGHALWNIGAIIHLMENNPELDDRPEYARHSSRAMSALNPIT